MSASDSSTSRMSSVHFTSLLAVQLDCLRATSRLKTCVSSSECSFARADNNLATALPTVPNPTNATLDLREPSNDVFSTYFKDVAIDLSSDFDLCELRHFHRFCNTNLDCLFYA